MLETSHRKLETCPNNQMLIRGSKSDFGNKGQSELFDHYSIEGINDALSRTTTNKISGNQGHEGNSCLISFIFRQQDNYFNLPLI
jgi:hypothetical protein